ncbi:tyrosine-type recombinase/integrase [Halorubrum halodurans]|uniref:Integrase n=1 Tax=Halorubrum halodurans TaxID=1383851 RepID=A0A256IJ37_9EURY|nr:site-specific integrase [Halorubrum halodurans]OYR56473.1 hypothetical protein DJ70_08535 [Halorubrum halodurans]
MERTSEGLPDSEALDELAQTILKDYNALKPLTPEQAVDKYLESLEEEVLSSTIAGYERDLGHFVRYCDKIDLENVNDLGGREIDGFEKWRRNESSEKVDSLANKTMRDDLYLFRAFVEYLEKIEAVPRGTAKKVDIPELSGDEGVKNVELELERVEDIVEYLEKYKYGSRLHVLFAIIAECGRRLGGVNSLDLSDAHLEGPNPYLRFTHHGDGRTRLKNETASEEEVNISKGLAEVIQDYIEHNRLEKTEGGRKPLLTTRYGRLTKTTIRSYFYRWSRPCKIGKECPEGRDEATCKAASSKDHASKCPVSEATHAARHGYITEMLRQGVSKELLSDRCDVSEEVLEKHYDERTTEEKRKHRRKELEEKGGL